MVWSLIKELRPHMLLGEAKGINKTSFLKKKKKHTVEEVSDLTLQPREKSYGSKGKKQKIKMVTAS